MSIQCPVDPHDCARDQACVDWARGEVEKVIRWCRDAEAHTRGNGDEQQAMKYRVAANIMTMRLVSGGCVISPFSQRAPEALRAMDTAVPWTAGR